MTRYFYDTEFIEDGRTIDLISIGIAADDGREYYAVSSDADWDRIRKRDWLLRNVVPWLPVTGRPSLDRYLRSSVNEYPRPSAEYIGLDLTSTEVKPHWVIANEVRDFILAAPEPELWADHAAFDHVALAWLYGPMSGLPAGIPMWTHDLRQEWERNGKPDLPPMPGVRQHHALDDAREVRMRFGWLAGRDAEK